MSELEQARANVRALEAEKAQREHDVKTMRAKMVEVWEVLAKLLPGVFISEEETSIIGLVKYVEAEMNRLRAREIDTITRKIRHQLVALGYVNLPDSEEPTASLLVGTLLDQHRDALKRLELAESQRSPFTYPELPESFIRAAMAALDAFAEGYAEYGPGAADSLGLAGQWGDLHRKVAKLKPVMWEGDSTRLKRETPQEVLRDIIGHCLLALDMYERGHEGGR